MMGMDFKSMIETFFRTLGITSILFIGTYFNIFFLVPKFFNQKNYWIYFLLLAFLFSTEWFIMVTYLFESSNVSIEVLNFHREVVREMNGTGIHNGVAIILSLSTLFISTLIKLLIDISHERSSRMDAIIKKQEVELKLVKNQYSPHFLLNALNNMHSISILNPERTSEHINRLSSLMNYVTYSLSKQKIPLVKEIDFIKDYIYFQLEKDESSYEVKQHISLSNEQIEIVPNVLFPFIENAFKHSYDPSQPGKVDIQITELNNIILLDVSNTYTDHKIEKDDFGVGLKNVKLILENEFERRHQLKTNKKNGVFSIELNISV